MKTDVLDRILGPHEGDGHGNIYVPAEEFGGICELVRQIKGSSDSDIAAMKERAYSVHNGPWLCPEDIETLFRLAETENHLKTWVASRNEEIGKAHALFTEAFSDGSRIAHTPETCNPLGFVKLLRERVEDEISDYSAVKDKNAALVKENDGLRKRYL